MLIKIILKKKPRNRVYFFENVRRGDPATGSFDKRNTNNYEYFAMQRDEQ